MEMNESFEASGIALFVFTSIIFIILLPTESRAWVCPLQLNN
jgi:hypothetical protein